VSVRTSIKEHMCVYYMSTEKRLEQLTGEVDCVLTKVKRDVQWFSGRYLDCVSNESVIISNS